MIAAIYARKSSERDPLTTGCQPTLGLRPAQDPALHATRAQRIRVARRGIHGARAVHLVIVTGAGYAPACYRRDGATGSAPTC
jgi:hypothetical protein